MNVRRTLAILSLLVMPGLAYAGGDSTALAEPGVIELLGLAAAAALAVAIRNRRRK